MNGTVELMVIVPAALAAGFAVWGLDRRRSRYGVLFAPGIALAACALAWILLRMAGLGSHPEAYWLVWAVPVAAALAAAAISVVLTAPRRARRDAADLERALRL